MSSKGNTSVEDLNKIINECVKTIDRQINKSNLREDIGDHNFEQFNKIFSQMKKDLAKNDDINKKADIIDKAAENLDKEFKVFSKQANKGILTKMTNLLSAVVDVVRTGGSEQALQKLEDAARVLDGDRMERVSYSRGKVAAANTEQRKAIGKHSERLLNKSSGKEEREVVGKHTEKLSEKSPDKGPGQTR